MPFNTKVKTQEDTIRYLDDFSYENAVVTVK